MLDYALYAVLGLLLLTALFKRLSHNSYLYLSQPFGVVHIQNDDVNARLSIGHITNTKTHTQGKGVFIAAHKASDDDAGLIGTFLLTEQQLAATADALSKQETSTLFWGVKRCIRIELSPSEHRLVIRHYVLGPLYTQYNLAIEDTHIHDMQHAFKLLLHSSAHTQFES